MIELSHLDKVYHKGGETVYALRDVSMTVRQGEFVSIIGSSGSGKTTLMNIMGCLDVPTSGAYRLDGSDVLKLSGKQVSKLRNQTIGFVFQNFNLIPSMTALENVELPLTLRGVPHKERKELAMAALDQVGLSARSAHRPSELSGGQQQRVAIARVLAAQPQLILADEPTGNLDTPSSNEVMKIMEEINGKGTTVVLITHDREVARRAATIRRMECGKLT